MNKLAANLWKAHKKDPKSLILSILESNIGVRVSEGLEHEELDNATQKGCTKNMERKR